MNTKDEKFNLTFTPKKNFTLMRLRKLNIKIHNMLNTMIGFSCLQSLIKKKFNVFIFQMSCEENKTIHI